MCSTSPTPRHPIAISKWQNPTGANDNAIAYLHEAQFLDGDPNTIYIADEDMTSGCDEVVSTPSTSPTTWLTSPSRASGPSGVGSAICRSASGRTFQLARPSRVHGRLRGRPADPRPPNPAQPKRAGRFVAEGMNSWGATYHTASSTSGTWALTAWTCSSSTRRRRHPSHQEAVPLQHRGGARRWHPGVVTDDSGRLLILDAPSLYFRAFFGVPRCTQRMARRQRAEGSARVHRVLVNARKPTHLVAASTLIGVRLAGGRSPDLQDPSGSGRHRGGRARRSRRQVPLMCGAGRPGHRLGRRSRLRG